jgi:flagellar motility protein MotE (MotC chaperone)
MIVTRRRKKPFPWKRLRTPAIAVVLLTLAFSWTPSRNWIVNGPLSPAWQRIGLWVRPVTRPFDSLGEAKTIADENQQIAALEKQLSDAQSQTADRDKQISALTSQLNQAQVEAAQAHTTAKGPAPSASATPAASDLSAQATPDMRRTAQVWASMDAEAASKIVQRLPQDYVARIFALMSPDSVGAILENLPPKYAAQLTEEHPELAH